MLIVTDANGCQDTASNTITGPDSLAISISILQSIACFGDSSSIEAIVTGGTPGAGYNYSWNGQPGGSVLSQISSGLYEVIVIDQNGCADTASIFVDEPPELIVSTIVSTPLTCAGDSNGVSLAVVTGGTSPYSYLWSNGILSDTVKSLTAGTYSVIVTDAFGCKDTQTVTLVAPSALQTTILETKAISCFGDSNGALEVTVSGGVTSYTYLWSTSSTSNSVSGLNSGFYSVIVEDGNGCIDSASYSLPEPDSLVGTAILVQSISCGGEANGILSRAISGGTLPYSSLWNPGGVTDSLFGVVPGLYQVSITDANGCTTADSIVVTEPDSLVLDIEKLAEVTCYGGNQGSLRASVNGGQSPYNWSWSNGVVGDTVTGLMAGSYTAVLTDGLGCVDSITFSLAEPSELLLSLTSLSATSCDSVSNGQATADLTGGTGPYQFSWSSGEVLDTAFALSSGWQVFTGTDSLGCVVSDSIWINARLPWSGDIVIIDTISCFGADDGMAEVVLTGSGQFQFFWSNGETANPAISLEADTTLVIVRDEEGCDTTISVVMDQPEDMIVLATVANTDPGLSNGAIRIDSVANGVGPFGYLWTNFATTRIISKLDTGLYQVEVTDVRGCTGSGSYRIGENVLEWQNIDAVQDCELGLVFLNWEILREAGVEFYSIERSNDGILYSRVGELSSQGDTTGFRLYSIPDTITPEQMISYRIRGHFFNGNTVASAPINVYACAVTSGFVDVYPRPVVQGDQLTAVFQTVFAQQTRIELRNALHQTLQFYDVPGPVGRQTVVFDTEDLASGHYYVIVSNAEEAYSSRVLVID